MQKKISVVSVSEAGASVYSASPIAREEFPDLDLTIRGAISIARRLQDPLAELVKVDPKSIGVGQYQHDVDQSRLGKSLEAVVEDAVNAVGVDLNTASAPLFQKKKVSRPNGMTLVARRSQSSSMGRWNAMFTCPCTSLPICSCAAATTRGWQCPVFVTPIPQVMSR